MMCFAETQIDLTILIWAVCPVRVTEDIFMSDIYKDISPFPKPIVIPQNVSYPSYLTTMPYQADKNMFETIQSDSFASPVLPHCS